MLEYILDGYFYLVENICSLLFALSIRLQKDNHFELICIKGVSSLFS